MCSVKRRLAIITEIIAPYRVPVFNKLAKDPNIDLHVIFLAETDTTRYQWRVDREAINFSYEILPSWRKRIGGWDFLFNWSLDETLSRLRPDTILCGGYNYVASWRALHWAKQSHVPFWLWVESTSSDRRSGSPLVESLKLRFMRQCDGFVVPGISARDYIKTYRGSAAVSLAPNAVDTNFFSAHSARIRKEAPELRRQLGLPAKYFLFVGRFVSAKGILDVLEAYSLLPGSVSDEVGLVLIGDGAARTRLERRAAKISHGAVQILGFAQQKELATYYGLAEIFVFPTHTDPWGLVVNEAMSCGLPVICSSAAGCAADLVRDGVNGRIVTPSDIGQLTSAMEELASDRETASRFGQQSQQIISHYSPAACAAGIAEIIGPKRAAA